MLHHAGAFILFACVHKVVEFKLCLNSNRFVLLGNIIEIGRKTSPTATQTQPKPPSQAQSSTLFRGPAPISLARSLSRLAGPLAFFSAGPGRLGSAQSGPERSASASPAPRARRAHAHARPTPVFADRPGPPGQARLPRLSRPRNRTPRSLPEMLACLPYQARMPRSRRALFKPPRSPPGTLSSPPQPPPHPSHPYAAAPSEQSPALPWPCLPAALQPPQSRALAPS